MIANYGYKDGSGEFFIIVDTDKCAACGEKPCVGACPENVLEVMVDDCNDEVIAVREEHRKKIKYSCAPCKPTGWTDTPCIRACAAGGIKHSEVEQGLLEEMAVEEAGRCLRCDLRLTINDPVLPPDSWMEFNEDNICLAPETEGVYQFLDENKKVLAIVGTANLRQALEDQLEYRDKVRYFGYEEDPMYTSRESQLIQQFLQEHGHLPEGIGDLDDLF